MQPELVLDAPSSLDELAPIVALSGRRIRRLPWTVIRDPAFRRQHYSAWEAAQRYRVSPVTVSKWIHQGKLNAVRGGQGGRLWVDRHELAAFLKGLPKPGTKTRAKLLKHQRTMRLKRLGRRGVL